MLKYLTGYSFQYLLVVSCYSVLNFVYGLIPALMGLIIYFYTTDTKNTTVMLFL
jgi:hypothetical protein